MDKDHPNWEQAASVGKVAPRFSLPGEDGQLYDVTAVSGPLLLVFYRGDW